MAEWSTLLGGKGIEVGSAVATDLDNSVFVVGSFQETVKFGGTQLDSAGETDAFLAKFSSSGALQWARRMGGNGTDEATGVAVDQATGDVVVIGRFTVTATVGNKTIRSDGVADIFLVRWSASGNPQWTVQLGTPTDDSAAGVVLDRNGDVLIAGDFAGDLRCGSTLLSSAGGNDMFIARVAGDGAFRWCRRVGGTSDESASGIAVSDTGLIALTGAFGESSNLGGASVKSRGFYDGFVAVYALADGAYRWARPIGSSGFDSANDVTFDRSGDLLATGSVSPLDNIVDFGGGPVTTLGFTDAFVIKYGGTDGDYLWAKTVGTSLDDSGNDIAVDENGEVVVTGESQESPTAVRFVRYNAFVARFSARGSQLQWRSYGDLQNDKAYGVAVDLEGSLYITGFTSYGIDLGNGPIYSVGFTDAFLGKLVEESPIPTPTYTPTALPPTRTLTPTRPPTATVTPTHTRVPATPTSASTSTATQPVPTNTSRPPTATFSPTFTRTPTFTASATPSATATPIAPTNTSTRVPATAISTGTPTPTRTATRPAPTDTPRPPTATFSPTFTRTRTPTATARATPSFTPTRPAPTNTATRAVATEATLTLTPTHTATRANTPTRTRTPTRAGTVARTNTPTSTGTPTRTGTSPRAATATRTSTRSAIVRTGTPIRTASPTFTATRTRTPTRTPTPRNTATRTSTRAATAVRTATPTRTPTGTITPTRTRTPTRVRTATPRFRPFGVRRGIYLDRLGISR